MIGSRAVVEDEAIAAVVRLYIEGAANGDAAKLKAAFNEHARTYGSLNGTQYDVSVAEMIALEERSHELMLPFEVDVLKVALPG